MNSSGPPFYGKYRGIVRQNDDQEKRGRIRAEVPDVLGDQVSNWAEPCVAYAGDGVGLYLVPPERAHVWVEFEHGDPKYPIWTGCYWGTRDELPCAPARPDLKVLKTAHYTITLDDDANAGALTIETDNKMKIVIDSSGIQIENGQGATVKLSGQQVSVNNGALEVM